MKTTFWSFVNSTSKGSSSKNNKIKSIIILSLLFLQIFIIIQPPKVNSAILALTTQKYTTNTPRSFFNNVPSSDNITASYGFRPIGNVHWGNQNTSNGAVNGNLSLTLPFITSGVNVNSTAFWYPISGLIGLSTVSAFIYFFKHNDTIAGKIYHTPNLKVRIVGTATANFNLTILFKNLHLIAVLRQIRNCSFNFDAVGFDWCDVTNVPVVFNPVFNATALSLTFVVPAGSFSIDPTTIGTSTTSGATIDNTQRKVFFCQTRYWAFYSDGTNIVWRTSLDGTTWTATTTVRVGTLSNFFSTWNDCTNTKIYYAFASIATTFQHRAGTLNTAGTITWDYAEVSVTTTNANAQNPTITKSSDSKLYIAIRTVKTAGGSTGGYVQVMVCTISGTNCGTSTNWSSSTNFQVNTSTATTQALDPIILPLASTKLSLVYQKVLGTAQLGIKTFSGTTWNAEVLTTSSYISSGGINDIYDALSISDTTHFAGQKSDGTILYWSCAYSCASAPSETTISSATTNNNAVISSDNSAEIIVSYATSGASTSIFYKISTNGGTSFGTEQTLVSSESLGTTTNGPSLTITYTKQNACYEFLWTSSSGFNVRFQCLTTAQIFSRTLSYTVTITDSMKKFPKLTVSPAVTIVDSIKKFAKLTLTLSVSITDSIKKLPKLTLTLSITISDSIKKFPKDSISSISVSITDSIKKFAKLNLVNPISVSITDSISKFTRRIFTLTNTISITDSIKKLAKLFFSQTITITDSIGHLFARTISNAITISTSIQKLAKLLISPLITISDFIKKTVQGITTTITTTLSKTVISQPEENWLVWILLLVILGTISIGTVIRRTGLRNKGYTES